METESHGKSAHPSRGSKQAKEWSHLKIDDDYSYEIATNGDRQRKTRVAGKDDKTTNGKLISLLARAELGETKLLANVQSAFC